jgi:hypothetical protein
VSQQAREPFRIRDHIGVISGLFLGIIAFLFVVAMAALGSEAALTLLVVVVVGIAMIAIGSRLRV